MTKQTGAKGGGPREDLCPFCGKNIVDSSRAGSLTSFLFQANKCQCGVHQAQQPRILPKGGDLSFCPRCGLQLAGSSLGSLTGFLFQDTRCKCAPGSVTIESREKARETYRSVELTPGVVIGGLYRIIELVGRGGMGEVYLAQHLTLEKPCALKLIPPDQVTNHGWQRFQIEVKSIAKLNHVNLVKVTDFGIHEGCLPYYAMEYVDGETLADLLGDRRPIPLPTILEIFVQICEGVDYAHRNGIVHRDLKPANIMLVTLPSGKFAVKILDFGLAKLTDDDRHKQSLTSVGDVFGSPFYMSPEQCIGGKIDNRSDIYSIGCTFFESLTGRPPFTGATAVEIVNGHQGADPPSLESLVGRNVFPDSLEVVLAKLLRKNPVERYQTLLELRGDLERVARGEDVQPFYVSRSSHVQKKSGAVGVIDGQESNDEQSSTVRLIIGRSLIAALIVAMLLGAGAIYYVAVHRQSAKSKRILRFSREASNVPAGIIEVHGQSTTIIAAGSDEARARDIFEKCLPIKSTILEESGTKKRRFVFPEWSIGTVVWGVGRTETPRKVEARGLVDVPPDVMLTLEIGSDRSTVVLDNPGVIDKIANGEFDALLILGKVTDDDGYRSLMSPSQRTNIVQILNRASHWSRLTYVSLNNIPINKDMLDALNKCQPLIHLTIFEPPEINSQELADQPFLGRLVKLQLYRVDQLKPVCESLSRSSALVALVFKDCGLSPEDLLALRTCPKLSLLELQQDNIDRVVPAVAQLPSLSEVRFKNAVLKPFQIKMITACANIRKLYLQRSAYSWDEINRCRLWEPKVTFEDR